jgi:hypothetical protein
MPQRAAIAAAGTSCDLPTSEYSCQELRNSMAFAAAKSRNGDFPDTAGDFEGLKRH